ncbi:MAG: hypothetical protein MJY89_01000 [Bacteroidales bacterium]|nr:hypothetical protein [Bacteroidales bacterium]
MKAYKAICLIATMMLSGVSLFSQNMTITLTDGAVYGGFLSKQNYNTGYVEINYSRMTKTIPIDDVMGRRTEKRELSSLSKEWQDWAIENNKVETVGKGKYLSLTTMTVKNQASRDYYVLISGDKYLTVFTISEGTEACRMSEIESIRKAERDNTLLTDVDDIIQTDNATYTGVLLEQIPGKSFTIWNKSDRSVHQIQYADVRSVGKSGFNQDYNIWKQTPYLERIQLKNRTTGNGLVIENGFGQDINFLFAEKNGDGMDTRQYRYSEIVAVERLRNPEYTPLYDIVLNEGESRINRDSTLMKVETIQLVKKDSSKFFVVDPSKMNLVANVATKDVFIETNTADVSDVYVAKAMILSNMPISMVTPKDNNEAQNEGKKLKKNKKNKELEETIDLYGYTYTALFESDIDADVETSINGTTKISFTLPEPGIYFVYLRRIGTCWAIKYEML